MVDFCKRDVLYRIRDELRVPANQNPSLGLLREAHDEIELLQSIIIEKIKRDHSLAPAKTIEAIEKAIKAQMEMGYNAEQDGLVAALEAIRAIKTETSK